MSRVLSWPHTPIFPHLLDTLKVDRHPTAVTDKGTIRFDLPRGTVEMKFSNPSQQLHPGTEVQVWWKGSGFVCATPEDIEAETHESEESRNIAERVHEVREQLAAARRERHERFVNELDIELPEVEAAELPPPVVETPESQPAAF
ncbi:hypothetical protein [Piscinibacter terrae]|uniref:Uncharacterized protein n=1 Tax=Piscinibacter terrae TaxID=2496871 RepID=A0A3N7J2K8_9BURK|nr:hypothetical protein [Albitalea terrae]RQP25172.1 hypothetical protein DZC73_10015 [Albitalea terrae]